MARKQINTKEHLLQVAGELFALHGFDVVSTRMIAEEAEVKLSAIHYHYGSKEKLYEAALTYAVDADSCADFSSVVAENPALFDTREGRAEIIRTTVYRTFYDHFKEETPKWTIHLVVREIMTPSIVFPHFADTVLKRDFETIEKLYLASKPSATATEISGWVDILHSQIFLYIMAKDALEIMRGEGSMDSAFYQGVARVVARAMIFELELPLPRDLQ